MLASTNRFASIDPAFQNVAGPNQFGKLAYDTLVTFQATRGPAGLRLVPDLALALPPPANGGTSYAFRLRRGIRYSDGRLLRASDFRRAIERLFRVGSPGRRLLLGPRRQRRLRTCAEGLQPRSRNQDGRRRRHRRVPPDSARSGLPLQADAVLLRCPDPPGSTRARRRAPRRCPAPGRIASCRGTAGRSRSGATAFFREWSHAAQPDGNPDAIVWRFYPSLRGRDARDQSRDEPTGSSALLSPRQLRQLRLELPAQVRDEPVVHRRLHPTQHARARPSTTCASGSALNLAIDRGRIVEMYGGPSAATPTCQPLPPGLLGFRWYCPYTAAPQADGAWNAPDLARARRLVAASGTRGQTIDLWGTTDRSSRPTRASRPTSRRVLRSLGYRTRPPPRSRSSSITYAQRRGQSSSRSTGTGVPTTRAASALLPAVLRLPRRLHQRLRLRSRARRGRWRRRRRAQLRDPAQAAAALGRGRPP